HHHLNSFLFAERKAQEAIEKLKLRKRIEKIFGGYFLFAADIHTTAIMINPIPMPPNKPIGTLPK
ncbi:MAG TPA: hypothetical protein VII99_04435, partial [Bacteroidia bacterium]